jgi:hypothetical protein
LTAHFAFVRFGVKRRANGTGKVELRTRVESNETELVLVPTDGWEPLWLGRTLT